MAKTKAVYFCQSCGAQASKWIGRCPNCNEWNTYVEELVSKEKSAHASIPGRRTATPVLLSEIQSKDDYRIPTQDAELNRVLGGGIVPGSVVLVGGEPGIGKSTLMLQLALQQKNAKVLYVSGEESESQIRMRAERLGFAETSCFVLTETNLQSIFRHLGELTPSLLIIDSIQTLSTDSIESSAGSVSQIRECTSELIRFAKETSTPVFLIGHITKDGSIAGPKVLEHMVDTVLQFEGDRHHIYRIIRAVKNRFGSASELGVYEMQGSGLKEISDPSQILLSQREERVSGIAVASSMEGMRPVLIEVQALVSSAVYGTPQRSATGFDLRRMNMLLAVLEKRCGFHLGSKDVFLNIAGGLRVEDPAIDLAVIAAILSSSQDIPLPEGSCFAGEVGLSGEIRPVNRIEQRVAEAAKLGFTTVYISKYNLKNIQVESGRIGISGLPTVEDFFSEIFG